MTSQAPGKELPVDSARPKVAAPVGVFFVLTFLVAWACWIPVVRLLRPGTPAISALWLLGVFAPALVALALTGWYEGGSSVRALLGRAVQWEVGGRWYVFAVSYMVLIKLAVALVHRVSLGSWPHFAHEGPGVILIAILLSTPVQAGEEIGWRGYALPRLAERMGFAWASLLLGVVWACWHLPQFFLRSADTYGQSFPICSLEVIAMSVAIAWLYTHTKGSVLLPMLMHSAVNNTKDIVPSGSANATNAFSLHASSVLYLTAALLWVTAAYFLARMPNTAK